MDIGDGRAAGRGTLLFLVIAFGWSWAVGALIWQTGAMQRPGLFQGLAFLFMWGPAVAALVCATLYDRGRRVAALGVRLRFTKASWLWLFLSWAIPVALIVVATLVDWAGPQVSPADPAAQLTAQARATLPGADIRTMPRAVAYAIVPLALVFGALFNWPLMISEELGWRGWLWDRWRRFGFWRGSILIGAVWGVWHAPLIVQGYNYSGMPVWGPVLMTIFCVLLGPLIGLVREKGGSVWHACLFHGTINAGVGLGMVMVSRGVGFPWLGMLGIGGAVACALGWVLAWLWLRRAPEF
jgi:membrane protease YdiL (CAAX protease family)